MTPLVVNWLTLTDLFQQLVLRDPQDAARLLDEFEHEVKTRLDVLKAADGE